MLSLERQQSCPEMTRAISCPKVLIFLLPLLLVSVATMMRISNPRVPAPAASLHARPQRSAGQGSRSNYRFKINHMEILRIIVVKLSCKMCEVCVRCRHLILLLRREPSTDDDLPPRRRHRCVFNSPIYSNSVSKRMPLFLGLHKVHVYMCSTDIFTCWSFVIPMLCRGRVGPGVSDGAGPGILSSRGVQPTVAQPRQRYIFTSLILLLKDLFPGLARGLFPHQPAQEAQVLMRRWRRREL